MSISACTKWQRQDTGLTARIIVSFGILAFLYIGIKWSLYVKILVSELSQDILSKKVQVKITESTITLVFQEEH